MWSLFSKAKILRYLFLLRYAILAVFLDDANVVPQLKNTIEEYGGQVQEVVPDGIINFNKLTHIISETSDFPQYSAARFQMIPVVTHDWITTSVLKGKQAQIRPYTPDPMLFFSKINISCADIPTGDKDAIIGAVLAMGGMESSSLTRMTTHICALTLDHPKCKAAQEKNFKVKIVLPHWYVECSCTTCPTNDTQV